VAFDAGRTAQNMILGAWNEGIGSCPNLMLDPDVVARVPGLEEDERPVIMLTFGYPARLAILSRRWYGAALVGTPVPATGRYALQGVQLRAGVELWAAAGRRSPVARG
jgi:Nitroreductase family